MPGTGAVQRREQEPPSPDLDGEMAAVLARIRRLLGKLGSEPGRERECVELVALERHVAEVRAAYQENTVTAYCREQFIELGRQMERAVQAPVPAPRRRTQQPGQHPLMRVVPG
jgi:hypothetical protein